MMICLDADCTIYFVEQHPVWGPKITQRLVDWRTQGHQVVVSDLARTECLAAPYARSDFALIADYLAFFNDPEVQTLPLTAEVCQRAAQLRAATNFQLKVPDCLHLAAAIHHGCGLFVTHDAQLARCGLIPIEWLV